MGERKHVPRRSLAIIFALLGSITGCGHPPIRAPARVLLPYGVGKQMQADLAAANLGLSDEQQFRLTGAHPTAGLLIERYTRADGLEVVLVPDPAAPLQALELWWPVGWCSSAKDPAPIPPGPADPRAVDGLGARIALEVGCSRSVRRWLLPPGPKAVSGALALEAHPAASQPAAPVDPETQLSLSLVRASDQALRARTGAPAPPETRPARPSLVVLTGPIDRQASLQTLGAWPPIAEPQPPPELPVGNLERRVELVAPGPPLLRLAWRLEGGELEEVLALQAVALVLTDGKESRLGRRLGATLGTSASGRAEVRAGALELEVWIGLDATATATLAASAVEAELKAIGSGLTTGLELERAKKALRQRALSAFSSIEGRGPAIAEALLVHHDLDRIALGLAYIEELPEPALRRVIGQNLLGRSPTVALSAPPSPPASEPTKAATAPAGGRR